AFTIEIVEQPLTPAQPQSVPTGGWQLFATAGNALVSPLRQFLSDMGGHGVVVCLPIQLDPSPSAPRPPQTTALEEEAVKLLLQGARAVLMNRDNARFVVVQHGCGAGGFARSLHLEAPDIVTCVIDVPANHPKAAEWIKTEIASATGFIEARYDAAGRRFEPRLRLLPMWDASGEEWPLSVDDVLL